MSSPASVVARPAERAAPRWWVRLWRGLRFRDALLVTVLPVTVVLLFFADAALRYARMIQFEDWWSARAGVTSFFAQRVHAAATIPTRVALRRGFSADLPDAGVIRLEVPRRSWDSLQSDPLAMWGSWIEGTLRYGGTSLPVRLRKRGDNSIHWTTDKRSLTVRTERDDFYKDFRNFALSVRDPLSAFLANRLGNEFGLLMPRTEVVPVFLNNQFYGIYRFVETVDESFLRAAGRMPGNVFRGDRAERGEYRKGTIRSLFDNPYLWERVSVNDRWTAAAPNQLARMIEDLRGTTFADHQRLMARFDADEMARLLAYLLVVGDPFHMDRVHNQFLYEDPSTQLLHPIPWDIRLLDLGKPETRPVNDLFQAMLSDPFVVDQVTREVSAALERGVESRGDSLVHAVEHRYADFLAYDRSRSGLVPDVGSADESAAQLRANGRLLRRWLANDTVAFHVAADGPLAVLDFETRGFTGVDLDGLEVEAGARPRLRQDRNLNGVLDESDPELSATWSGGRLALAQPMPLYPGWNTEGHGVAPGRMSYRFFLVGATSARPLLRNRVSGQAATVVEWQDGAPIAEPTGWHPWLYRARTPVVHRLRGETHLTTTLLIPAGDSLVIEPGTTIRLDPDVSIVSSGPVRAVGEANRPIRVIPAETGRPWGTFSLQGHGADGSQIRHVEFRGGGGALVGRIEFIGMVNVHRVKGVVVDSATFIANVRSDDTFHALHAVVDVTNSRFVDANGDAVDFDTSVGTIMGNRFEGSGGDAIDLMASSPRIIGNRISNAADKGISIGEASHPFVFDNLVERSGIGVEIKDGSSPVLLSNEFRSSGLGLRSRLKNWRYGSSGFGTLVNTLFDANVEPIELDSLARVVEAGVQGLDSIPRAVAPVAARWLYAAYGIAVDSPGIGLPGAWRSIPARPAIESHRFHDDFESMSDGWRPGPRVARLDKRGNVLVVDAEGGTGVVTRDVDWDLGPSGGGVLVLALSGRDVDTLRVVTEGASGTETHAVAPRGGLSRFSLVEVPLRAERYRRVRLEIVPTEGLSHIQRSTGLSVLRAGRLALRWYAVYPNGPGEPER
ncbi:MAG: CotH kinase family protein [Gemmatimonadales bacterium]